MTEGGRALLGRAWGAVRAPGVRWAWWAAGIGIFLGVRWLAGGTMAADAAFSLGVLAGAAFLWATNSLPLPVTGVLVIFLLGFGKGEFVRSSYQAFGSEAVFFILGAFMLASPVMRSGLSKRVALWVMTHFGKTKRTLVGSILVTAAGLSLFISEHVVVAMLLPIVREVLEATGARRQGRFAVGVLLALAWGAVIGGTGTLLGGARGALALGVLDKVSGAHISFAEWMSWNLPNVAALLAIGGLLALLLVRGQQVPLGRAREQLRRDAAAMGPVSSREKRTAAILLGTVLLWILVGETWGLDTVAFLGVLAAFLFQVASWREVEEDVNWGIFLMYASAIALGQVLVSTGAAAALADGLVRPAGMAPAATLAVVAVVAGGLTEAMSNTAAVAVLMPVALALAQKVGLDPRAATMAVATPAGLAFLLPASTPAIAMVAGTGYVSMKQILARGLLLKLVSIPVFLLVAWLWWPLVMR